MDRYTLSLECKRQQEWSKPYMWLEMSIGGISGALFIVSLLLQSDISLIVSTLLLIAGKGLLLLADLGRPIQFIRVLSCPGKSWITRGSWGFVAFAALSIVSILPLLVSSLPWSPYSGLGSAFAIVAALAAAFMMIYDALALMQSKGIAFWRESVLPIVYFSNATVGGIGAFFLLQGIIALPVLRPEIFESLFLINIAGIIVYAISLFVLLSSALNGTDAAVISAKSLLKGNLAACFWIGSVILGIVVPFALQAFGGTVMSALLASAGACSIISVFVLRFCILKVGIYDAAL